MSESLFSYVAADESEWDIALVLPGPAPWATIEATPVAGGLPITWNMDPAVLGVLGPRVMGDVITSINERCQPCL